MDTRSRAFNPVEEKLGLFRRVGAGLPRRACIVDFIEKSQTSSFCSFVKMEFLGLERGEA